MTDSIYLLQPDDSLVRVSQAPCALESDLQRLLDRYPELLLLDVMQWAVERIRDADG